MGEVFLARDEQTSSHVAIKVLRNHRKEDLTRFQREVNAITSLSHESVVPYVAHGFTEAGDPYLVMAWLEGEDLFTHLRRRGTLPVDEALAVAVQVAAGLGAAHRVGIVHRDVKPANVFLVGADVKRTRVLDFGIARSFFDSTYLTRTGEMLGTPGYMPPEQIRG